MFRAFHGGQLIQEAFTLDAVVAKVVRDFADRLANQDVAVWSASGRLVAVVRGRFDRSRGGCVPPDIVRLESPAAF